MTQANLVGLEPGDVLEEWGVHDCCCEHVVDTLMARPGSEQERYEATRERYRDCPHKWLTTLEVYLGSLR